MKMTKLVILWTTESEDNFFDMITPFALKSKDNEWFREVIIIIWGGSAKAVAKHRNIKEELSIFIDNGISVKCSQKVAEKYGIVDDLEKLGVDVSPMSEKFKNYMSEGARVVSV